MVSFENLILKLQQFWQKNANCAILPSCDQEVGAATLNPFTAFRVLDDNPLSFSQVQFCRRPADARFAENSNRLTGYYQLQVIIKPSLQNIQKLCLDSFREIGIDTDMHDFRFVEDNWSNPSIGATGVGYEVWCDNMEILQFTYMEQVCGIKCKLNPVELTYGLERVAMYVQGVDSIFDIKYNDSGAKYSDFHQVRNEIEYSKYYKDCDFDKNDLFERFDKFVKTSKNLINEKLPLISYEYAVKASQVLNIIDARGYISQNDRASKLLIIRDSVCEAAALWLNVK